MADPLGLISGGGGGLRGINPNQSGQSPFKAAATDANGATFKDVLMQNIEEVNKLQGDAAAAQEDLVTGKRNDVESVLIATQKADQAFRMLLAVRNKMQAAYDELKQTRI